MTRQTLNYRDAEATSGGMCALRKIEKHDQCRIPGNEQCVGHLVPFQQIDQLLGSIYPQAVASAGPNARLRECYRLAARLRRMEQQVECIPVQIFRAQHKMFCRLRQAPQRSQESSRACSSQRRKRLSELSADKP